MNKWQKQQIPKVEQAIRMLHGNCPHNRPDSEAPKSKGNCITCIAETAIETLIDAFNEDVEPKDLQIYTPMPRPMAMGDWDDYWTRY